MGLLQLTFPDDDDEPALGLQLPPDLLVPLLVARDLGLPEIRVGPGDRVVFAILVAVPETAVDEDGRAVFGEDDIGGAGQLMDVEPISESLLPESASQNYLRASVICPIMRHAFKALRVCHSVRHGIRILLNSNKYKNKLFDLNRVFRNFTPLLNRTD